jgi:hypothetical protein
VLISFEGQPAEVRIQMQEFLNAFSNPTLATKTEGPTGKMKMPLSVVTEMPADQTEAPKKRHRRTKAEIEAARAAEAEAIKAQAQDAGYNVSGGDEPPEVSETQTVGTFSHPTFEDVERTIRQFHQKHADINKTLAVLQQFGVQKPRQLKPEQYHDVIQKFQAGL